MIQKKFEIIPLSSFHRHKRGFFNDEFNETESDSNSDNDWEMTMRELSGKNDTMNRRSQFRAFAIFFRLRISMELSLNAFAHTDRNRAGIS